MLSMAYNNYRGRTGGRLMFYLYSMDRNADYWAGIGETEIEDCGVKIGDFTWEEGTDFAKDSLRISAEIEESQVTFSRNNE